MFTKRNTLVSLALAFIMIICSGCFNHNATQPASLFNPSTWGDTVPIITTAVATRPVGDFTLEPNTLGAPILLAQSPTHREMASGPSPA